MNQQQLKNIIEGALLTAGQPLTVHRLLALFEAEDQPSHQEIHDVLDRLSEEYESRGMELKEVASGFRIQIKQSLAPWVSKLWEERPVRYSRALLETLALIVYRQPITRAEIEEVRGVSVSTSIIKTLLEREWVRVVGHKEVPGKPALYGTTSEFLDYFNLKKLDELPDLSELSDLDSIEKKFKNELSAINVTLRQA